MAVIGTSRIGSSLIWTLLERVNHLKLTRPKEFLNNYSELSLKELVKECPSGSVVMTHVRIAEYSYRESRADINGERLTLLETVNWLKDLGFSRFIHLYRANLLRCLLSRMRAGWGGDLEEKIRFLHKNEIQPAPKAPLHVDCEKVLMQMENYEEITNRLRSILATEDSLGIIYENDLMEDYMVGYRKILEFGQLVSDHPPQTSLTRTNPYKVRDVVENFGELKIALKYTPWEWMLYY